jgi:hypothetical protein
MRRKLVVVAALILSACNTMPNGFGYTEAEGKHPVHSQYEDYMACWHQYGGENLGMNYWLDSPRDKRLHLDACMGLDGWKDISLDRFPL